MPRLQILLGLFSLYDSNDQPAVTISGTGGNGWQWVVETVQPIRGTEIRTIPREGASTDLRFTLCRQHADPTSAQVFLFTYPQSIVRGGQVQIIATPEAGHSTTMYLTNGALQSVSEPQILGCRTWHTHNLIGGRWVTRLP